MRFHRGKPYTSKFRLNDIIWFPVARVMVCLCSLVTLLPRQLCSSRLQRSSRMKLCNQVSSVGDLSPFNVAIVGGGYAGLACGYHLQQMFLDGTVPQQRLNLSFYAREPEPTGKIHGTWCASAVSAGLLVSVYRAILSNLMSHLSHHPTTTLATPVTFFITYLMNYPQSTLSTAASHHSSW